MMAPLHLLGLETILSLNPALILKKESTYVLFLKIKISLILVLSNITKLCAQRHRILSEENFKQIISFLEKTEEELENKKDTSSLSIISSFFQKSKNEEFEKELSLISPIELKAEKNLNAEQTPVHAAMAGSTPQSFPKSIGEKASTTNRGTPSTFLKTSTKTSSMGEKSTEKNSSLGLGKEGRESCGEKMLKKEKGNSSFTDNVAYPPSESEEEEGEAEEESKHECSEEGKGESKGRKLLNILQERTAQSQYPQHHTQTIHQHLKQSDSQTQDPQSFQFHLINLPGNTLSKTQLDQSDFANFRQLINQQDQFAFQIPTHLTLKKKQSIDSVSLDGSFEEGFLTPK
jgi:hypothetical protein